MVKWEGTTSSSFIVQPGVRQGGIVSTNLYKRFKNGQLDRIKEMEIWFHIGEICCAAQSVANHMALRSTSLAIWQRFVSTALDYSKFEKYVLQPHKSPILAIFNICKRVQENDHDINTTMDEMRMPEVKKDMHMGSCRSVGSQESAIHHNIDNETYYILSNGTDPDNEHILQTYIVPLLVYELEVLLPRKALMEKVTRFY